MLPNLVFGSRSLSTALFAGICVQLCSFVVKKLCGLRRFWIALSALAAVVHVEAHPAAVTGAVARVESDGAVHVALTFDALAFALNDTPDRVADADMNALLDGPRAELERRMADARRHFVEHFAVVADGVPGTISRLRFPTAADVQTWGAARPGPRLPVLLSCDVDATISPATRRIAFRFPEVIGSVVLTVERPALEPFTEPVSAGTTSTALALSPSPRAGSSAPTPPLAERLLGFIRLGFTHILPRGLDHVLFVLGLCLLAGRVSTLLWQITAFTAAHSVSLGLAAAGIIRVPAPIIEPLITASIVLVALDNLRGAELRWWRVAVVFGFGLVHGMGFAGALRELALAPHDLLVALVGFNIGVELGQLAVVAVFFALIGWFRLSDRYRTFVVIPASSAIAVVALVWTAQRLGW